MTDFLARLITLLESLGIDYMVVGSFASTFYGPPRTTQDIDVVVDLDREHLVNLLDALPEDDYYVSREAALDALRRRGQFNVIDMATSWKADLILRKLHAFGREEFGRRRRVTLAGVLLWLASPEDVILAKLDWCRGRAAENRQIDDVVGVLRSHGAALDMEYLELHIRQLALDEEWRIAQRRLNPE